MNTDELQKFRFFEALRFALALAACFAVLAWTAFTQGCASPGELPPGAIDFVTNYAQRVAVAVREAHEQSQDPATGSPGSEAGVSSGVAGSASSSNPQETTGPATPDAGADAGVAGPILDFRYGGFKGSKATEDSRCRISKLKIGSDSLTFRWDTKIPGDWKRETLEKGPMIVVAAFVWDGGRWIGGKFDWIDESRSSRSLENIKGGYGGWDGTSWTAAKKHAVCVVSADGKFRSNLITD